MKLLNKIVDYIFQYLMSRKLSIYKVGLSLVLFGSLLFGTGTYDFIIKDFSFKWDNSSSIIEYLIGIFLIVSAQINP